MTWVCLLYLSINKVYKYFIYIPLFLTKLKCFSVQCFLFFFKRIYFCELVAVQKAPRQRRRSVMENLQISWLRWKKFPLPAVVFGPPPQIGPAAPPNGDAAQESRIEAAAGQALDHKPPGWVQYYADCFYSKNCCCYCGIGKNTIFHFLLQHSLCSQFYPATTSNLQQPFTS